MENPGGKKPKKKKAKVKLPKYVVEKDGHWFVKLQLPKADGSGYETRRAKCRDKTQGEVDRLESVLRSEHKERQEAPIAIENETVSQFLERFLNLKKLGWATMTYDRRRGLFESYIKGTPFSFQSLIDLKAQSKSLSDSACIQNFYEYLRKERGTTANMVHEIHRFLSQAFNMAMLWDEMVKNPCKGVLLPKRTKNDMYVLDETEAKALRDASKTKLKWVIFHFALVTFARPEEYLALTWSDIDFERREVTINKAVVSGFSGGGYEFKETKTDGSRRTLKLTASLCERLLELKKYQAAWAIELRRMRRKTANETLANIKKYNLVFPNTHGGPQNRHFLGWYRLGKCAEAAKIKNHICLYSLRHTGATLALKNGAPIKAVAEQMGHTDIKLLLTRYIHVLPNMRNAVTDVMAGILNE